MSIIAIDAHPSPGIQYYLQPEFAFEFAFFEALLDGHQVARGIGTINQLMVIGQCQVHHRADTDGLVAVRILDHHGALDDCANAEDTDLGGVEHRGIE